MPLLSGMLSQDMPLIVIFGLTLHNSVVLNHQCQCFMHSDSKLQQS